MANVRALATAALLVTFASGASIAMPPQDIPTEVKSCKAIIDDKERLKCFDGLFGGASKSQKPLQERQVEEPPEQKQMKEPSEEKQANWSIDESESPTGGSLQVVGANLVNEHRSHSALQGTNYRSCFFDEVQLSWVQIR